VNEAPEMNDDRDDNGYTDAIAATAIIAVVVLTTCLWLAGLP